jgi:hypothetical protein
MTLYYDFFILYYDFLFCTMIFFYFCTVIFFYFVLWFFILYYNFLFCTMIFLFCTMIFYFVQWLFYFVLWPTNARLFHKLSHSYIFRHYCVILRELVINTFQNYIHSFSSLSYDRSKASSKASFPHSAIQSFLLQMRVPSPFLKVIQ